MGIVLGTERRREPILSDAMPHQLVLEDRGHCTANGVVNVLQCDENAVVMETSKGLLTVGGQNLSVQKLDLESNTIVFQGTIDVLSYSDRTGVQTFWQKFFR